MAAGIDVHAAVLEAGRISDADSRDREVEAPDNIVALGLRRQQLQKSLHAVEKTVAVAGSHKHSVAAGLESITFSRNSGRRVYSENDSI